MSISYRYKSVSCVVSHLFTTVSASQWLLKLWSPRVSFSEGNITIPRRRIPIIQLVYIFSYEIIHHLWPYLIHKYRFWEVLEVESELQSVWWPNAKVNINIMRSVWYSEQSDNQIRAHDAFHCIPNTCILNINAVIRRTNRFKALTVSYKDWQRDQQNMLALKNDSKTIAWFVEGTT